MRTIITGTGSYIPEKIVTNASFLHHDFYNENHEKIETENAIIVEKFEAITGIAERRYAKDDQCTSDIGLIAAQRAIEDAKIDMESLDQIIFAHNYGDVKFGSKQCDSVPSLASRVKGKLGINNPNCIAYDVMFGCPGWLQGVIQADAFFKAGMAKKILVIGAETLSRVIDPHDRDSMIFSDGAGAVVLEYKDTKNDSGIISSAAQSHCINEVDYINSGTSYKESEDKIGYIKMKGRKVYEYAIKNVPAAIKICLEQCNISIHEVKKIFIHQANEKLDDGILKALYRLYEIKDMPMHIMPMNIHLHGNSSVATIPTLYDTVKKGLMTDHEVNEGDIVLFASVGAGMHINAVCYRV